MKRTLTFICCLIISFSFLGCASQNTKTEKLRDLEFTVLDKDDIPESFMEEIAKRVEKGFKLTFEDQGYLYIAEGYGKQETSGYSIEVAKLYETENVIYVQTDLIGPANDEEIVERPTYPYIVLKTESADKNVVFR
jgi:hypothetical protein